MKKSLLCIFCAFAFAFSFYGCGAKNDSIGIYDLQSAMLSADESLPEMKTVNSSSENASALFSYLCDLDYSKVDSFFLAYCADGKKADEIAVVKLKSSNDTQEAQNLINEHVQKRISLYKTYGPDQVSRAQKAQVFSQSGYVVLIICDNQSAVKSAFENAIKGE